MTRTQHYLEAERLLTAASHSPADAAPEIAMAQVHATLALAGPVIAGDPLSTAR